MSKESPCLHLQSLPLSLKSTSAWLPDPPWRGPGQSPATVEPTRAPPERLSLWLMGWVRGFVTLTLVKEQLGVQFRRGALPADQRLASVSMPPCWQPHECFRVLWSLPGEPGLILLSSTLPLQPATWTLVLMEGAGMWSSRCRYWTSSGRFSSLPPSA